MSDLDAPDMVSEIMDIADPERHPIQGETWACVSACGLLLLQGLRHVPGSCAFFTLVKRS